MSQGQDWNAPGANPAPQQSAGQWYGQPSLNQQQAPASAGYQPMPYQQPQPYQQQPYQQGYAGPPVMQVAPKNAGIALLISFFIPGVGSLYASKTNTGIIILIGYIISWILTIVIIGFVGVFGFWIWGMIDAYQAAQAWNRAHGIVS
jgi:TM2 domain-containing membrane protein YozV